MEGFKTLDSMENTQRLQQAANTIYPVSRGDSKYASKTLANIKRAQWKDYMERYPAIHQQYMDMTMNPDLSLAQVDRVQGNVNKAYQRAGNAQNATLARMGITNNTVNDGVDQALSIAHGENSVRQHGKDRQLSAMAGGALPNLQTQTGG